MRDPAHLLNWLPALWFPTSRRPLSLLAAAFVSTLLLLYTWHNQQLVEHVVSTTLHPSTWLNANTEGPLCRQLPGVDDVVVVMKTGANEVEDKLTIHLRTSLTCYPNHVIFSDYEEDLPTGQHLYDAFRYTSSSLKESHADFALWRKLQAEGRAGLLPSELSGTNSRHKSEKIRNKIPGWHLDKWKFLPMVNQTLSLYPGKHWYVFVEADTYLIWSNLLPYIAIKSWVDDQYIGSRAAMEGLAFAHGGTGFLLSRPALEKVANLFNSNQQQWESFTGKRLVGDHILGAALKEAGVLLRDDQPTWQGKPFSRLDLRPDSRFWCSTALTSHHQMPSEIEDLWNFEQDWILETAMRTGQSRLLRQQDLLKKYVLPRIQQTRSAWDNEADQPQDFPVNSLLECEALCEQDTTCMQYALRANKTCHTTSKVIFGQASDEVESGWMFERIQKKVNNSPAC